MATWPNFNPINYGLEIDKLNIPLIERWRKEYLENYANIFVENSDKWNHITKANGRKVKIRKRKE